MSGTDEHEPEPETDSARHGLEELIAERRAKAPAEKSDPDAFPYSFPGVEPIESILAAYEHLPPARRPRTNTASPAGSPRGVARARRRSSTSSTAPARCNCTRASTCSARTRSRA